MVVPEEGVVPADQAPDRPFARFEIPAGGGLSYVDDIGSFLISADHPDVSDCALGGVDLRENEAIA